MGLTQRSPGLHFEVGAFIPDRPTRWVSGELVASTVEYDDERERTPFPETKHRVPIAVSEWRRRCHSSFELVPMIGGRS